MVYRHYYNQHIPNQSTGFGQKVINTVEYGAALKGLYDFGKFTYNTVRLVAPYVAEYGYNLIPLL